MSLPTLVRCALAGLLLSSLAAQAQTPSQANMQSRIQQLEQRFQAADVNHDGLVSREEAQAHMPMVYKNFAQIDTAGKGAVSIEQIEAYASSRMAARRGAQ